MPITQTRFVALITAAEHFQNTINTLRDSFNLKCRAIATHQLTIEQAFTELTHEFNTTVPYDSTATGILMAERVRYTLTHKRNDTEKRRIYAKRHPPLTDSPVLTPPPRPHQPKLQPRSASEVAAAINSTDEAFDGLSDLASEFDEPSPSDIRAAIDRALRGES